MRAQRSGGRGQGRGLFALTLFLTVANPLAAQPSQSGRWTLSVRGGTAFGGPAGEMRDKLLAEGWVDQSCSVRHDECHDTPVLRRPGLQLAATAIRRLNRSFDLLLAASGGTLGSAEGQKGVRSVTASWNAMTVASGLSVSPIQWFRIGAGPMFGLLFRDALPRIIVNPGLLVETGLRTSPRKPLFIELSVSYRLMPRRHEEGWPGREGAATGVGGVSPLDAKWSHLTTGVGVGWRF